MKRRDLLLAIGGAAIAPLATRAQQAPARLGLLFAGAEGSVMSKGYLAELSEGLRAKGLAEGRDYVIEARYAVGRYDRFPIWRASWRGSVPG
jgi:putative ABC transport system substrate-binding protein